MLKFILKTVITLATILALAGLVPGLRAQAPTVTGFTPISGMLGDSITVTGTNFTGVTGVSFKTGLTGYAAAGYRMLSATSIKVAVAAGGNISVTNATNTATSNASFKLNLFTEVANTGLPATSFCNISWGDYDNDGDLDAIFKSNGSSTLSIYRNTAGIFTDINAGITGLYGGSQAWGDYDNDGDVDILCSGSAGNNSFFVKIYRNTSGIFSRC